MIGVKPRRTMSRLERGLLLLVVFLIAALMTLWVLHVGLPLVHAHVWVRLS